MLRIISSSQTDADYVENVWLPFHSKVTCSFENAMYTVRYIVRKF
jgi:hypothetical protein